MADITERSASTRRGFLTAGAAVAAAIVAGEAIQPPQAAEAATTVTSVNGKTGDVALAATDVNAASQTQADGTAVVALPTRFSGIDPSGSRDSTVGLQAAINATPEGGTVIIPPGRYLLDGSLSVGGEKSITMSAFGARFVQNKASAGISVGGSYSDPVGVTSISTTNPATVGGGGLPVSVIKTSSSQGWVRGDVLKIVSDDIIPEGRPGSSGLESRLGEFVVVRTANGQTVTLAGLIRETYSTNIRVARVSEKTFAIEGAEFETTAAGLTTNYGSLIYLYRLKNPTVSRVKVVNASSAAIHFSSCFGYSVYDADISYAVDNPQNSQVGYGVFDNASSHGRVIGGLFRHVRHAYTDDTARIAANSALTGYGRSYGARIIGGSALNTTSNSWDTHHCSEGTEFVSCTATGGLAESTFGIAGFGIRGKNHRVTNGTVLNMENGVAVFNEGGGGETHGTVITNLVVRNAQTTAVQVFVHSDGHPKENTMDTEENVTIDGLTAVDCTRMINVKNAVVTIRNAEYTAPAGADGTSYDGITTKNSLVRVYTSVLDYSRNTKGTPRPVVAITSTGYTPARQQTFIDGLEVRLSASVAARAPKAFNGVNHEIKGQNIRFDYPFSIMPGDKAASSMMQWSCTAGSGVANADLNSSYIYLSTTALKTPFAGVLQTTDLQVVIRAVPGTTAYSVAALPAGKVRGQFVTLWMSDTSSGSLTIANGAAARTLFIGGASKVLKKGMQMRVFWDGTLWRETA